jgi:nucleotide-binding universal stress UspA family protein
MRILIAVDASQISNHVVDYVSSKPWPKDTEIKVLTVVVDAVPLTTETETEAYSQLINQNLKERSKSLNDQATELLQRCGYRADSSLHYGDPHRVIIEESVKWRADLIVIGAHGYNSPTKFLLGSVSNHVIENASCPVVVVRMPQNRVVNRHKFNIVLATDGSDCAMEAARTITRWAWPEETLVHVVSVIDPLDVITAPLGLPNSINISLQETYNRMAKDGVAVAEELLKEAGIRTSNALLRGHPRMQIINEAKRLAADLIVVGVRGRGEVSQVTPGSISSGVATYAQCPVAVVRKPIY